MANINVADVDLWFEYADLLQDLADICNELRTIRRSSLSSKEKDTLKFLAVKLAGDAVTWATIAGESLIDSLNSQLTELKAEIGKLEALESEIKSVGSFISGVAKVIDIVADIFKWFPKRL